MRFVSVRLAFHAQERVRFAWVRHIFGARAIPQRPPRRAFTLQEILVVLAIIAVLTALLFPVFARSRENARRAACQSNMKQIGLALVQYAQDYDGANPPRYSGDSPVRAQIGDDAIVGGARANSNPRNWRVLIFPYVRSAATFQCPSNPKSELSATNLTVAPAGTPDIHVSYACNYNSGTGLGVFSNFDGEDLTRDSSFETPSEMIAVAETTSTRPDIDMDDIALFGQLYAGHLGYTNYLFVDGHAKALLPLQTYYAGDQIRNMWQRDLSEFPREEVPAP